MSDTTSTSTPGQHRCPSCGVVLEAPRGEGACPACLMSAVLRADAETAPIDGEGASRAFGSGSSSRETAWAPGELPCELGDYTLVRQLGRGGMGTVYEGVHRATGRRLALKLLAQNLESPEMRQRFLREGRLAARVNHPSSLYVFGSEEIDGIPVITMEIAPGGTLQDTLDRRGPLTVTEAVDAVTDMIDGLEAAFDRGVLHRDIKPSNCFVSPDGTIKVGDFGLSVSTLPSADSFLTQTGRVMGTPAFASPEQLRGDDVDVRSDIYSVGATLFTLLTARAPFEGDNAVQVVANVIDTPPADVAELRDDLPPGLSQVIARCLAKEPGGRFAGYAALRDALLPFGSVAPEPATESQRGAAGWIDYLTAFLPAYAIVMIVIGPERLFVRPLYDFSLYAWRYHLAILGVGFVYFALTEGLWGAGLGKWIMKLRVVRKNGRLPGPGRALVRIVIPFLVIEAVRIPLTMLAMPDGAWGPLNSLLLIGLATACPWVAVLLWLTARPGNGQATAWDLLTGTRVVVRPRGVRRPAEPALAVDGDSGVPARFAGPFEVAGEIEPGSWLDARDPMLRRRVWLMRRTENAVPDARRAVARPGRARWLQETESGGDVWDAFEADRGRPLRERLAGGPLAWSSARHWLHDLAAELRAAERDATLAEAYSLDHVWITDDGRAMLLDTPWPHGDAPADRVGVGTVDGQQRFLQMIVDRVDPLSVPLHARPVLQNLRGGSFEKLTYLAGTLKCLLNKPADMGRGLRGASLFVIPGYASLATFLGIAANTDPDVGLWTWLGRGVIAVLVMMNIIALFDVVLAVFSKSTGLTTFGMELVTKTGRASRARMLWRCAIVWFPVVALTVALGLAAMSNGSWIPFEHAVTLGVLAIAVSMVFVASALINPTRGLHDRLAGVWVGRR